MKKLSFVLVLAAMALLLSQSCKKDQEGQATDKPAEPGAAVTTPGAATAPMEDTVWIRVNGKDIMRSDVEKEMDHIRTEMSAKMPMGKMDGMEDMIKYQAMQRAVERAIVKQAVETEGVTVDQAELDKEMDNIKSQFPSDEAFQQQLEQMGISEDNVKDDIKTYLSFNKLYEGKNEVTEPTEEEIQEVYDRSKERLVQPEQAEVLHILVSTPPMASDAEKAKKLDEAKEISKKAKAGEDFAKLAETFSDSPVKDNGGKQTFKKGQVPGDFDSVVFSMKPGEVSDPIETPMGYYVVKMIEVTPEKTIPIEDVKEDIVNFLKDEKKKEGMSEYVQGLKDGAKIEYLEPLPDLSAMMGGMSPHGGPPPSQPPADAPPSGTDTE